MICNPLLCTMLPHIALYCSAEENVPALVAQIMAGKVFTFAAGLELQQGALFSMATIRQLVQEELLHDNFDVVTPNGHSLATSSSGEQRRAVLQYLLAQKPDYLVADNVLESLDQQSQLDIVEQLEAIADTTRIIQIIYRKKDCLSFIDRVATVQNGKIIKEQTRVEFLSGALQSSNFAGSIPQPLQAPVLHHEVLVALDKVSVHFNDRPVLRDINWQIKAGEFWQLVGPNGSGKTTLLSIITGDSEKGYGQQLYLFGKKKGSGETVWDIKQHIGYFTAALNREFPRRDTIEAIIIGGFFDSLGLYNIPGDQQVELAREWLQVLHLLPLKDRAFRDCTAGQQRLVLIARAMIKHPPLLILDEPTSGLDDAQAALFIALVNKIAAETTTAILYVSHRKEAGLQAKMIFELIPSAGGSTKK